MRPFCVLCNKVLAEYNKQLSMARARYARRAREDHICGKKIHRTSDAQETEDLDARDKHD